ncbi:N-6 DNA methylase [Facklamia hominis]|uniref:N-6 DNA methylase n=1 Tax=Facklamia hominis TaxID=178214 RepID=UPI00101C9327|nr:N-6 DNA methylase [Facklamia hominis]RYC97877.1 N-6 DNA methylase [Facklamia hominis]
MELQILRDRLMELFDIKSIQDLGAKLLDCVLDNDQQKMTNYVKLVDGDLDTDYLQNIYQYYCADRENLGQDFTPISLAKLMGKFVDQEDPVIDLCAGSGALTIQSWCLNPHRQFICYEFDQNVIPFLLFNLAIRNIKGQVINSDVLKQEVFKTFQLEKGERFSHVWIDQ